MRLLALASLTIAVTSLTALAAADPMEGRYGNTQVMTEADGKVMRANFNRDKTVELTRPDGETMKGEWEIEGDQLCVKMSMMLISMKRCMPFVPDKKPGDKWTQKNPQGDEVQATIVAGKN